MSRINTLRAGSARTAQLAAAIRAAADDPSIAVVRLQQKWTARGDRPYRAIVAYHADYTWYNLGQDAVDVIDMLIRGARPDIDWWKDHDWHLDTGMLRRSPLVGELGGIPENDRTFGGGDPVFLVDSAPAAKPAPGALVAAP